MGRPTSPDVTVMMPCYNAAPFVDSAVLSILAQTDPNWELLAFDDGSSDCTYERLCFWAEQDERIVVDRPHTEAGHYGELCEEMLVAARGLYVARMDADDISMPTRLARQKDFLHDNPQASLVGGMARAIMEERGGVIIDDYPWLANLVQPAASETTPANDALRRFNVMVHTTILAAKDDVLEVGGYDPDLFPLEDWDLALKLADLGKVYILPDILALKRQHANNGSRRHPNLGPAFEIIRARHELPLMELPKVPKTVAE